MPAWGFQCPAFPGNFHCKGCRWGRLKYWGVLGIPKDIHVAVMCSRHLYPLSLGTTSEVIPTFSGHFQ